MDSDPNAIATNCHNLALNSRIFGTKAFTNRHKY